MAKRTYTGPSPEVEIPLTDGSIIFAKNGVEVEVPDSIVKSLDAQGWLKSKAKPKPEPPKED